MYDRNEFEGAAILAYRRVDPGLVYAINRAKKLLDLHTDEGKPV